VIDQGTAEGGKKAENDPEVRFRESYPGFLIVIGLLSPGHLVDQLAIGQAWVCEIGSPLSY